MEKYNEKDNSKREPFRQSRSVKRILIKKKGDPPEDSLHGVAVATIGAIVLVKSDNELFECVIGGTLITKYDKTSLVATGDEVWFTLESDISTGYETGLRKGVIRKIGKRMTKLSRRAPGKGESEHVIASNADQMMIFMAAVNPMYNKRLIDRYQIAAELGDIKVIICINKIDILDEEEVEIIKEDLSVYEDLGDDIIFISSLKSTNIEELYSRFLKDKTTILSGPSGAGKSTLVNTLLGGKVQAVKAISETTAKGKHTTSFTRMFDLPDGGKLIDTPGIREFALWDIDINELPLFFRDFKDYYLNCKYNSCSHIHEPGCAVKEAVESGEIQYDRYLSYINLYESFKQ